MQKTNHGFRSKNLRTAISLTVEFWICKRNIAEKTHHNSMNLQYQCKLVDTNMKTNQ